MTYAIEAGFVYFSMEETEGQSKHRGRSYGESEAGIILQGLPDIWKFPQTSETS